MSRLFGLIVLTVILCGAAHAQAPVRVALATAQPIETTLDVPGTATSLRTATLSTAVAGMVAELSVDAGTRITSGDQLLKLDAELVELSVARLRAQVQRQKASVDDARRRFEEARDVGPDKGIARTTIETLRAGVAMEEAALAAARAELREQQALVARHTLTAPFNGVISTRFAELGEWLDPGDPVFELVALDELRFDFRVSQDYAADVTLETPVVLALGGTREPVIGRVDAIVPVNDPATRTFLVRVVLDRSEKSDLSFVQPGMSAVGRFGLASGRAGLTVSRDAVLRFPDGRVTVWVVEGIGESPLVRERRVVTGREFSGQIEIREGLIDGDVVVVRGNETLSDGQSVVILDADG